MKFKGLSQSLGVTLYCSAVGAFFLNAERIIGKTPNYFGPVAFLLLLSASVLVCALIVFYEPYKLFFISNKKKEALDLVVRTTAWLFGFLVIALLLAVTL